MSTIRRNGPLASACGLAECFTRKLRNDAPSRS